MYIHVFKSYNQVIANYMITYPQTAVKLANRRRHDCLKLVTHICMYILIYIHII